MAQQRRNICGLSLGLFLVLLLPYDAFAQELTGVQILEKTGSFTLVYFDSADRRLHERISALGDGENDFVGTAGEVYDVFWSNSAGHADLHGDFLTIEGRFRGQANDFGGGNIAEIDLLLSDGGLISADRVVGYTLGSIGGEEASVGNAADSDPATSTVLGATSAALERFRITVAFPPSVTIKNPDGRKAPVPADTDSFLPQSEQVEIVDTRQITLPLEFAPQQIVVVGDRSQSRALVFAQNMQEIRMLELDVTNPASSAVQTAASELHRLRFPNANPGKFFVRRSHSGTAPTLWALQLEDVGHSALFEVASGDSGPVVQKRAVIESSIEAETEILSGEFDEHPDIDLAIVNQTQRTVSVFGMRETNTALHSRLIASVAVPAELPGRLTVQKADINLDGIDDLLLLLDSGYSQFVVGRKQAQPLTLGWSTQFLAYGPAAEFYSAYADSKPGKPKLGQGIVAVNPAGLIHRIHFVDGTSARISPMQLNSLVTAVVRHLHGDFNGDGTQDLLALPENGRRWLGLILTGDYPKNVSLALPLPAERDRYFVFDANQDGIDEIFALSMGLTSQHAVLHVFSTSGSRPVPATPDDEAPRPCIAYNPSSPQEWGYSFNLCPKNYAWMFVDDASATEQNPELMRLQGTCCPLPSREILTDENTFTETVCPDDSIVTGAIFSDSTDIQSRQLMRCTRVNGAKFKLGKSLPGVYWGTGYSGADNSERKVKHQIPAAVRLAAGRIDRSNWDLDGCAGQPWGSLLTGRTGPACDKLLFAVIERKDSGPPAAVKVYPDCLRLPKPFDPLGECLR